MKRRHFLAAGLAAAALPQTASPLTLLPAVDLANDLWKIEIDHDSLAIRVQPAGQAWINVSRGGGPADIFDTTQSATRATWSRKPPGSKTPHQVTAELDGRDLNITVTAAQATTLDLIDQPAAATGRGLILPLAEGSYAPAGNPTWRDYLTHQKSEMSTTDDMATPLWGLDHGDFTLHWLLTNPFNNLLAFTPDGDGVQLKVSHAFTTLAPATPMTLTLHLGGPDLLAGAKRYRRHRIETDAWESLTDKIAAAPDTAKLIGASHIYLWGNDLLSSADVRDWPAFLNVLRGPSPLAVHLRAQFGPEAVQQLNAAKPNPPAFEKDALIASLNAAVTALARQQWQTDTADAPSLVAAYPDLRDQIVETFGTTLAPDPATWGLGLSQRTVGALKNSGLSRLWIGLGDGWEGGLWQPQAVKAAVNAGYLIGPYDTYGGAIKPGDRPDWATSQLGKTVFETCGVVRQDGKLQPGFQQAGVYVDTVCTRPMMEGRMTAIQQATGFNSWFLDVTASGLVFDNYRPGHESTMAQNAVANADAARWVSQTMKLPLGSEDGKAITTGGITFAHGMEAPVIWGDPDMQKTATSPWYLGNWWPGSQPSVFFKPVPIKPIYAEVWFAPEHRLPLYQTVFHGSVITTHHWWFDNLKLSNVRAQRELTQLLYNVPPLYHLSAGTLKDRLPVIVKQDAFFRPLHEALYDKTLETFAWLSDDRQVQATTFSDGSRLMANFSVAPYMIDGVTLPATSITAWLPGQPPKTYQA